MIFKYSAINYYVTLKMEFSDLAKMVDEKQEINLKWPNLEIRF